MSTDLHFAALAAWLTGRSSEVMLSLSHPHWNWDRFVDLAASSGVLNALPSQLTPDLSAQLPEEIHHLLSTAQELNHQRNQAALAQITDLAAALNSLNIQPVALKGLANLLAGVYPNLGMRFMADLDILVQPHEIGQSVDVMKSLGYVVEDTDRIEFSIGHTYPVLFKSGALEVDLHRTTGLGVAAAFLPAYALLAHSLVHPLQRGVIRLPSPSHLVIHHILHSQLHDVYRARVVPSLRTLYDFYLLSRHFELDWPAISEEFRSKGQYQTFALYLLQAQHYLGMPPPVALQVSPLTRLRHRRRLLLRSYPQLRLLDPSYYLFAGVKQRTIRLREILSHPRGLRYLLRKLTSRKFYSRLRSDFGD